MGVIGCGRRVVRVRTTDLGGGVGGGNLKRMSFSRGAPGESGREEEMLVPAKDGGIVDITLKEPQRKEEKGGVEELSITSDSS